MKIGVSTGSFFLKEYNENALSILNDLKVKNVEVFLTSYSEYKAEYVKLLNERKGNLNVFSIHPNGTQFEPQLFSGHQRQKEDAILILKDFLSAGQSLGAKYYSFHGQTRLKKMAKPINFENCSRNINIICDIAESYGIGISYETVEYCYFNYPDFFVNMRNLCPKLNCVLDIKQIKITGQNYTDFLKVMEGRVSHVHVTGFNEQGLTCLPHNSTFDFETLFKRLQDASFDGCIMIEVYKNDYKEYAELKTSVDFLEEKLYKLGLYK